jgi:hypothetical protein
VEFTEFTDKIYQLASRHLRGEAADFEPDWKKLLAEFQRWTAQPAGQSMSSLNAKLYFLQMLLKQFPALDALKTDPCVVDLVLADSRMVGDKVVDPQFGACVITRRSIGDRFGVLYTMKKANGALVSFEFFD